MSSRDSQAVVPPVSTVRPACGRGSLCASARPADRACGRSPSIPWPRAASHLFAPYPVRLLDFFFWHLNVIGFHKFFHGIDFHQNFPLSTNTKIQLYEKHDNFDRLLGEVVSTPTSPISLATPLPSDSRLHCDPFSLELISPLRHLLSREYLPSDPSLRLHSPIL
jgi:hypothetical protein